MLSQDLTRDFRDFMLSQDLTRDLPKSRFDP